MWLLQKAGRRVGVGSDKKRPNPQSSVTDFNLNKLLREAYGSVIVGFAKNGIWSVDWKVTPDCGTAPTMKQVLIPGPNPRNWHHGAKLRIYSKNTEYSFPSECTISAYNF
jgi:hypothetical protein